MACACRAMTDWELRQAAARGETTPVSPVGWLRIVARDLPDFERLLRRRIMTLPGAGDVEANVLLSEERLPGPLGV